MMTLKTFRSLTTAIGANSCIKCSSQLIPKITLKMKKQKNLSLYFRIKVKISSEKTDHHSLCSKIKQMQSHKAKKRIMKGRRISLLVCEGYSEKTNYFTMLMKPLVMDKACN